MSSSPAASPFDVPRQLLQLDPQQPGALGRARRVHRQRLADDDRRLGRQQPALGLVDRARDAVEARRDVDDRGAREALVAVPARRLGEREVDLHLRAAEAEAPAGFRDRRPRRLEQPPVELRRRHVAITARRGADLLAVAEPHARRPGRRATTTRSTSRPVSQAPPWSSISRTSASTRRAPPPRGIGMPPSCDRDAITWVMKPDAAASGPSPVWSTHGASRPCARSDANVVRQPVAARRQHVAAERREPAAAEPPVRLHAEPRRPHRTTARCRGRRRRAPRCGRNATRHRHRPRLGPSSAAFASRRVGEERALAVRERRRRRVLGVQVLEPARGELVAELRVRRPADPERMPGAEDVVQEAGLGQLRGLDRAAELVARARARRRASRRARAARRRRAS